ncbi:MAG: EVE domain-containing protein [Candidatus Eisenbacteria bacterium]
MPKKEAAGHWLFKTEPSTFSFEDLEAKKNGDVWDGVKNALALKHLAQVRRGDEILIYHTGDEKAIVGVARAVRDPYPDPKQDDPKLLVVDVQAVRRLPFPVALSVLKKEPRYAEFDLVRLPRLSVMPVPGGLWKDILGRGGLT